GRQGPSDLSGRQRGTGGGRRAAGARRPQLAQARLTMAAGERKVIAVADGDAVARTAAGRLLSRISANSDRISICLTGGSGPVKLYELLASADYRSKIPWARVHWFIGDERFVPATDPLNNMATARRIVLDACAPVENIHPIPTDTGNPDENAVRYEQ